MSRTKGWRRTHRMIGAVLILPFLGWALTGLIFFIKPGYGDAYASLSVKTYPLAGEVVFEAREDWLDQRLVRTILGRHLLVRTKTERLHLNADTLQPWPQPSDADLIRLVNDALPENSTRYGLATSVVDSAVHTDTDVRISVFWSTLSFFQSGPDTRRIDGFYKVHYLQWTPWKGVNQVMGVAGLILLCVMTVTGVRLLLGR